METILLKTSFNIDLAHLSLYFIYLLLSVLFLWVFSKIYIKFTPHNEIELISAGNLAVAISFSGALLGFAINLAFSIFYSHNIYEYALYGTISTIVQLLCYKIIGIFFKNFSDEITNYGNIPVATFYAILAVIVGLINGVCGL